MEYLFSRKIMLNFLKLRNPKISKTYTESLLFTTALTSSTKNVLSCTALNAKPYLRVKSDTLVEIVQITKSRNPKKNPKFRIAFLGNLGIVAYPLNGPVRFKNLKILDSAKPVFLPYRFRGNLGPGRWY